MFRLFCGVLLVLSFGGFCLLRVLICCWCFIVGWFVVFDLLFWLFALVDLNFYILVGVLGLGVLGLGWVF